MREAGTKERTALLAMSMALAALGIDLMLPAFGAMRDDLGLERGSTAIAGIVTAYFLGLALGQLVYGPLSDRFGRRPVLYAGYLIYGVGALLGAVAPSLGPLLVTRFVWGLGAAGPRVVTQAVIRDTSVGDEMARAISFVMAIFLVVPVIAPTVGDVIVSAVSWRWLFVGCVGMAVVVAVWAQRLPETLPVERRLELRLSRVARAAREVVTHREALLYLLAMTSLYGSFMSYIASSEAIVGDTFGHTDAFPYVFGGLGVVMGAAMLTNARLVGRFSARRVVHAILFVQVGTSAVFVVAAVATDGAPPFVAFLLIMAVLVSCQCLLIPNCTSIAMEPMGAIAGTASSVIGSIQIAVGAVLGSVVDNAFDGTVRPLAIAFLASGLAALGFIVWAERGRLFRPAEAPVEPAVLATFEV